MKQIKVIEESNKDTFEKAVNVLVNNDYKILSTNCGFVNSKEYDFSPLYQAILGI